MPSGPVPREGQILQMHGLKWGDSPDSTVDMLYFDQLGNLVAHVGQGKGAFVLPGGAALRSGSGAPSNSLGDNGDLYIDKSATAAAALYQKSTGTWGLLPTSGGSPSGAAGGSLTGNFPNPTIAAGAVSSSMVDSSVEVTAHKNAASGYAGLNSSTLLSTAQMGTGTQDAVHYLRGDGTWHTASQAFADIGRATALSVNLQGVDHTVLPATSLQTQINNASAGSTLNVTAGIYRETVTVDKNLTIDFQGTASLKGSDVWGDDQWMRPSVGSSPEVWMSLSAVPSFADLDQFNAPQGQKPYHVYYDHLPLKLVAPWYKPRSGQFAISRTGRVVLADDPIGHLVEVTTRVDGLRIGTNSSDGTISVTVKNADIRHFGSHNNDGHTALYVHNQTLTLQSSTIAHNHGTGIEAHIKAGSLIDSCEIAFNGCLGANISQDWIGTGSYPLSNSSFTNNKLHHNNLLGFSWGYQSGGVKFSVTNHMQVTGNQAYSNNGPGLWMDVFNTEATIQNNRCWDNEAAGIMFEVSGQNSAYSGTATDISSNVVFESSFSDFWPAGNNGYHDGGIFISSSVNVNVHDNIVAWCFTPIQVLWDANRSSLPVATASLNNIKIYSNKIIGETVFPGATNGASNFDFLLNFTQIGGSGELFSASNVGGYLNQVYMLDYTATGDTGDSHSNFWFNASYTSVSAFNATKGGNLGSNGASSYISTSAWTLDGASRPVLPAAVQSVLSGASAASISGMPLQPALGHGNSYIDAQNQDPMLSGVGTYTVRADGWDRHILVDASGGAKTITLPDAQQFYELGQEIFIMKVDSSGNAVTYQSVSSQGINGGTSGTLSSQYSKVVLVSSGFQWYIKST